MSSFTHTGPRHHQSEESGGVLTTQEGAFRNNTAEEEDEEYDEREATESRYGETKEEENDIEYIIMNLYSKMKNLENKYIDLANYYKHELVKTSSAKKEDTIYGGNSIQDNRRAPFGGSHTPGRTVPIDID